MERSSTRLDRRPAAEAPQASGAQQPPLAVLLREGFRWFMERLNEEAGSLGDPRLSAAAAVVVSHLRPDGSRPADIARAMGVTRQYVHAVVRELVDSDVVQVVPDPTSRRDRLIVPTVRGEARRRRAVERLSALEAELGERIGAGELEHLRELMVQLWSPRPGRSSRPSEGSAAAGEDPEPLAGR